MLYVYLYFMLEYFNMLVEYSLLDYNYYTNKHLKRDICTEEFFSYINNRKNHKFISRFSSNYFNLNFCPIIWEVEFEDNKLYTNSLEYRANIGYIQCLRRK